MSDVILVVLGRTESARGLLQAAAEFRRLMTEARVSVLALEQPAHTSALEAEALVAEADALVQQKPTERARIAALERIYEQWLVEIGAEGNDVRWARAQGNAATVVGERGSRSDLVVVGQPTERDSRGRQVFRAALFATDRPVLMVPGEWQGHLGRCVAIAWRDDRPTARAVIPALRCLASAEEVHVLAGTRHGLPPDVPRVLVEHGIRARLHPLAIGSGPFGRALLSKAHELGADLVVMGAYAHSPLRGLILGGVTQYMLDHADVPVLMRH